MQSVWRQSNGSNYQGVIFMGESGYLAGMNGKIEITLPGANAFARNMTIDRFGIKQKLRRNPKCEKPP